MPIIPKYNQETIAGFERGIRSGGASAAEFGGQTARAMQQFGGTVAQVADVMQQQFDNAQVSDAQAAIAKKRTEWTQIAQERESSMQPGDTNYAGKIRDDMREDMAKLEENYTSDKARQYVKLHGESSVGTFFEHSLEVQRQGVMKKALIDYGDEHEANKKTVFANPDMYESIISELEYNTENGIGYLGNLEINKRRELSSNARQELAWTTIMKAKDDPIKRGLYLGALESGKGIDDLAWNDLTIENQLRAKQMMETQHGHETSVAKHAMDARRRDAEAALALGQTLKTEFTKADFAVYGDQAPAEWDDHQSMARTYRVVANAINLPLDKGLEKVAALKPVQISGKPAGVFAEETKDYLTAQRLVLEAYKNLQEDQISVATQRNIGVKINDIDMSDADKFGLSLAKRIPQAKAIKETSELPSLKLFGNEEAASIGNGLHKSDTATQISYLKSARRSLDNDGYHSFIQQVFPNSAGIFKAGMILGSRNTTSANGRQREVVAETLLKGASFIDQTIKGAGTETERSAKGKALPSDTDGMKLFAQVTEGVWEDRTPEEMQSSYEAVKAYYVGSMLSKGSIDMEVKGNETEFKDAVKTIIGVPVEIGQRKVIAPWGMDSSRFSSEVEKRGDTLGLKRGTYGLTLVGQNKYEVVKGGRTTGQIFDFNKSLTEGMIRRTENK